MKSLAAKFAEKPPQCAEDRERERLSNLVLCICKYRRCLFHVNWEEMLVVTCYTIKIFLRINNRVYDSDIDSFAEDFFWT